MASLQIRKYIINLQNKIDSARRVARNSQLGGCFGGLGAEPPEANGGLGEKPPGAGGWGCGPGSKILHFLQK